MKPFLRIVTGAFALAALIVAAGCGGSQPAPPESSIVAAPPPSTDQPKERDETTEFVQADVPALQPIHFELDEYQITRDAQPTQHAGLTTIRRRHFAPWTRCVLGLEDRLDQLALAERARTLDAAARRAGDELFMRQLAQVVGVHRLVDSTT